MKSLFLALAMVAVGAASAGAQVLEVIDLPGDGPEQMSSVTVLELGRPYLIRASGTIDWDTSSPGLTDAEYGFDPTNPSVLFDTLLGGGDPDIIEVDIGVAINDAVIDADMFPYWGPYNTDHVYEIEFVGLGEPILLSYMDTWYPDNAGALTIEIIGPTDGPVPTATGSFSKIKSLYQ